MSSAFLDELPPRMSIVHLKTQDAITAQYNPTEVNEKLGSAWARMKVVGQSFEELQYIQTKNMTIDLTMHFDEKSATGVRIPAFEGAPKRLADALPRVTRTSDAILTIRSDTQAGSVVETSQRGITSQPGRTLVSRNFLMACQYPVRGAQEVRDGAPSRLLFVWPGLWSIVCRLMDASFAHTTFAKRGGPGRFAATLKLEVDSIGQRLTYEDVLEQGTRRHDGSVQG